MIDPSLLLDGLNDKQREAVAAPLENLLIWPVLAVVNPRAGAPNCVADVGGRSLTVFGDGSDLYQQSRSRNAWPN